MKGIMILVVSTMAFGSCQTKFEHNKAGFEKMNTMLKDKFGAEAYYTAVSLSVSDGDSYALIADKSDTKDQIRQERWVKAGGDWENGGVVNMQVNAAKPEFYKFQLDKEVQLPLLGSLIDSAKTRWAKELPGKTSVLQLATINTNNTVTDQQTKYQYTVILSDKDAREQTHSYTYDREGNYIRSN